MTSWSPQRPHSSSPQKQQLLFETLSGSQCPFAREFTEKLVPAPQPPQTPPQSIWMLSAPNYRPTILPGMLSQWDLQLQTHRPHPALTARLSRSKLQSPCVCHHIRAVASVTSPSSPIISSHPWGHWGRVICCSTGLRGAASVSMALDIYNCFAPFPLRSSRPYCLQLTSPADHLLTSRSSSRI